MNPSRRRRVLRVSRLIVAAPALLLAWQVSSAPMARAASPTIVISQVYGGGGNAGATFRNDFIELFNRGNTTVSITGWSVQYASSTGTSWSATPLSGSLAPGQYYLVQEAVGAGGTTNLPTPDTTGTIAMAAGAGKVALTSSTAALSGACPSSGVVDFVGYGAANCAEGTPTAALSNTTAALRAGSGCTETDVNSADFSVGAPNPRNTSSGSSPCGDGPTNPSGNGTASPNLVAPGASTLLTVSVSPGQSPVSTGIAVTADLQAINGDAAQTFYNDQTHGDATAGDSVFSFQASTTGSTTGLKSLPATITDAEGRHGSAAIVLTVQDPAPVVISQLYGGGGNAGATFRNDFIELFNRTNAPVDVTGWSVQYTSSAGASWARTTLSGIIGAGQYYLVEEAAGTGGTINLAPDATGTITMSATAGKVALVASDVALTSGGCPFASSVVDFVAYGGGASCFEGTAATTAPSNTTSVRRVFGGCTDENNNVSDFGSGAPEPRNSTFPPVDCSAPPPPPVPIHEIQGSGNASPLVGQVATTQGVVTALRFNNGFFLQTPDDEGDASTDTSEGIFVFTGSAPPAAAAVGNFVQVRGVVQEFVPSQDVNSPPVTEISGSPIVALISTGNTLPAPIVLTAADTSPTGSIEQLERLEGMRVSVPSLTAVAPTQGSVNEPSATSSSNGVFYGVITGVARPFREPGVQEPDPLPPGSPCCVPRFDGNPERLRVDADGQVGAVSFDVSTGAVVSGLVGPLDFSFRTYTILPDPAPAPVVAGSLAAVPVAEPAADQFTVASANLERFFDTASNSSAPVLTAAAFANRLHKASLMIRDVLRTPDIVGVEEVENISTLQSLADKINDDAVLAGDPSPHYAAYLEEGNDIGGIDSGFLVKTARVHVESVTQEGKDARLSLDGSLLNDRPPLILTATIADPGGRPYPVTVIVNHLRSLTNVDDPTSVGNRVRHKRQAQAEFLANLIQSRQAAHPQERILSVGDYNAFQFSDGFVDTIGIVKGTPAPADEVVLASADLVNPDLVDLVDTVPADRRYSYSFDGNAQEIDHVLVTQNLLGTFEGLHYGRTNADFAESYRNDQTRPERISDHDPVVAYFTLPANVPPVADAGPAQTVDADATCHALVTLDGSLSSDPDGDELTYTWTGPFGTASGVSPTVSLTRGTHVVGLSVDDGFGGIRTATVTITVRDVTAPVVTLAGANPLTHQAFTPFVDPGATAVDACDGPVVVSATSTVNASVPGTYAITYSAHDAASNVTSASRTVKVVDTVAPVITSVTASPNVLWPPIHLPFPVRVTVKATDAAGTPSCRITSVTNDETGSRDAFVIAPLWVLLVAERNGRGDGRVYTIGVTCTDPSGNAATATTTVRVPHDRGHGGH